MLFTWKLPGLGGCELGILSPQRRLGAAAWSVIPMAGQEGRCVGMKATATIVMLVLSSFVHDLVGFGKSGLGFSEERRERRRGK